MGAPGSSMAGVVGAAGPSRSLARDRRVEVLIKIATDQDGN
jgi:hypothetical protein